MTKITVNTRTAAKLLLVCNHLDTPIQVMDYNTGQFKKGNGLDMVRLGVTGPTLKEVKERLE